MKHLIHGWSILLLMLLAAGCGRPLVSNLSEYHTLNSSTKYLVITEVDSGFELSLYFKSDDFYTEKRHLAAEAELIFKKVAKSLCNQKGRHDELIQNWIVHHL